MTFNPEWVGSIAAFCTTVAFLPQTIKVLRTRDTQSISLGMYVTFTIGVSLWLCYGLLIGSTPIWVSNIIVLMMSLTILIMKLRHG